MVIQGVGISVWLVLGQTGSPLFVSPINKFRFMSARNHRCTLGGTESALLRVTLQGRVRY